MRDLDLGLTGDGPAFGQPIVKGGQAIMKLKFHPGERVDKTRVNKIMEDLITKSYNQNTDFKFVHYEIESIGIDLTNTPTH